MLVIIVNTYQDGFEQDRILNSPDALLLETQKKDIHRVGSAMSFVVNLENLKN